jgi:hypothetical protein
MAGRERRAAPSRVEAVRFSGCEPAGFLPKFLTSFGIIVLFCCNTIVIWSIELRKIWIRYLNLHCARSRGNICS